jgi:hypothetical protein
LRGSNRIRKREEESERERERERERVSESVVSREEREGKNKKYGSFLTLWEDVLKFFVIKK